MMYRSIVETSLNMQSKNKNKKLKKIKKERNIKLYRKGLF